jgi:hypothetical protein
VRKIKLHADTAIEAVGGYRIYGVEAGQPSLGVMALAIQRDAHPLLGLGITQDEARDNAKRMELCWNAFYDLPSEVIALMPAPVSDLARHYAEAHADRTRLLSALLRVFECPALSVESLADEDRMALAEAFSALEACGKVMS